MHFAGREREEDRDNDIDEEVLFDQAGLLNGGVINRELTLPANGRILPIVPPVVRPGKVFHTLALFAAYFGQGVCMAIPGPTLIDLQHLLGVSFGVMGYLYTARSIGYLSGSCLGGSLLDRCNRTFLAFVALVCSAIGMGAVPWCTKIEFMMICLVSTGLSMGILEVACNSLTMDLWGKKSKFCMQAFHFSFALGAFIAPILAQPFLSTTSELGYNGTLTTTGHRSLRYTDEILPSLQALEFTQNYEFDNTFKMNSKIHQAPQVYERTKRETNETAIFNSNTSIAQTTTIKPDNIATPKLTSVAAESYPSTHPLAVIETVLLQAQSNSTNENMTIKSTTPDILGPTTITSIENVGSTELDTTALNITITEFSTTKPGTSTSSTTVKPKKYKPQTDGSLLDNTKDWETVKIPKLDPQPQPLPTSPLPPTTTNATLTVTPIVLANATVTPIPNATLVITTDATVLKKSISEIEILTTVNTPLLDNNTTDSEDGNATTTNDVDVISGQDFLGEPLPPTPQNTDSEDGNAITIKAVSLTSGQDTFGELPPRSPQTTDSEDGNATTINDGGTSKPEIPLGELPSHTISQTFPGTPFTDNYTQTADNVNVKLGYSPVSPLSSDASRSSAVDKSTSTTKDRTIISENTAELVTQQSLNSLSNTTSAHLVSISDQTSIVMTPITTPYSTTRDESSAFSDLIAEKINEETVTKSRGKYRGQQRTSQDTDLQTNSDHLILPESTSPIIPATISSTSTISIISTTSPSTISTSESSTMRTTVAALQVLTLTSKHNFKPITFDNDIEDRKDLLSFVQEAEKYGVTKIHIVYTIIAVYMLHVSFSFLFFLCSKTPRSNRETIPCKTPQISSPVSYVVFVSLMFVVVFCYVSIEVAYGQYVLSFAVKSDLHMNKTDGAYVTALFWGSFALTRFLSIFFVDKIPPFSIIIANIAVCAVGTFSLFSANTSSSSLRTGSALLGIGMATMSHTVKKWADSCVSVNSRTRTASVFIVAVAMGEMISTMTVGNLMTNNPMVLTYHIGSAVLICAIAFITASWFAKRRSLGIRYQLANSCDEEGIEHPGQNLQIFA